ncbi:MAG: citrate lyase acyl carrier protein [Deltaproteobacteria bacterium]
MTVRSAQAGVRGERGRSDCWVEVEPRSTGGLDLSVTTKVEAMYGDRVRATCRDVLAALGVENARVVIEDRGALDYALAARLEAAVARAGLGNGRTFLPPAGPGLQAAARRERPRRSRLYLPGNDPKLFLNAHLHGPDGIILDLEDSVAPASKDEARFLVRNALRSVDFGRSERMVRINQGERGLGDVDAVAPHNVHVLLLPKVESAEQVRAVDDRVHRAGASCLLMPIIESALGCFNALAIASASPSVVALTIGLEDYTADIGTERTREGKESLWARQVVVNAARAAGITPIDSVFSDVADTEGLRQSVLEARALGFEGKGCIHPRQVSVVHEAFAPTEAEIDRAVRIVLAFEDAERKGLGVVALGSKMIDPPVVKRALRVVDGAEALGLLPRDWRARNGTGAP